MFAPPPETDAVVLARYPDELRTATADNAWNKRQPKGIAASSFLEGPCFDRSGRLWCVDVVNGRLLTVDEDGQFEVRLSYGGWPNGLQEASDGSIIVSDHKFGLLRHTPGTSEFEILADSPPDGSLFKGFNDLRIAKNGDIYFTDQGSTGLHDATGRLFRMSPDGTIDCLLDTIPSPNGLELIDDDSTILLAVTRANAVWRVPLHDGGVVKVGTFIQMSGGIGPDGLAAGPEGEIAVAHAGLGVVWIFNRIGEPTQKIRTPGLLPTSVAFSSSSEVVITEVTSGAILLAQLCNSPRS